MELPLWIIAVCMMIIIFSKGVVIFLDWYIMRSRYGPRNWFKKSVNWIMNGQYE